MKFRFGKICISLRDILFFLFVSSVFDRLKVSIPFFILCFLIFLKDNITKPKKIFHSGNKWYFCVFLMFLFGIFYSNDSNLSDFIIFDFIRMLQCFFIMLWISYYTNEKDDLMHFMKIFVLVMGILFFKLLIYTPFSYWGTERLGETIDLKPTMLGLSMAFGGTVTFYLWQEKKKKMYLFITLIFLIISLLSGSRMGALTMFLGISCYFVISASGKNVIRNCFLVIFSLFLGYYMIMNVDSLYNTIGVRFENFFSADNAEQSVQERDILKSSALDLFRQHPILGSGTEGFRAYSLKIDLYRATYSHCNYTEMLANYGSIGFLIYYLFLLYLFLKLLKLCRNGKLESILFVFLLMILVSDYGYISYYGLFQQYFLGIITTYFSLMKSKSKELEKK